MKTEILTLHLSTLTNSTCLPPKAVTELSLGIPTSSRTSDSFAPPHVAAIQRVKILQSQKLNRKQKCILLFIQ
jgi:hypothetical protein